MANSVGTIWSLPAAARSNSDRSVPVDDDGSFEFKATGFAILWRIFGLALLAMLVIPIPWLIRYYANWIISQISVTQPSSNTLAA
jgi:hypothetical protein